MAVATVRSGDLTSEQMRGRRLARAADGAIRVTPDRDLLFAG
jgi:hypothetical protein